VLVVLILVPGPQMVAEVQPIALMAVEYFPASHSVHTEVPPEEYFPAVQSSQITLEVGVLAILILVPAPHVLAEVQPTALVAAEYFPASHSVHTEVPPTEYFPAVQSSQMASEVDVLAVLILVPAPHVLAEVQPTALMAVEYFPASHSVHSTASPMEYFPAVQSSQTVSDVDVLTVFILVPAPHVVAEVHPTALVAVEYLPASHSVHTSVPPMEYFPAVQSSHFVSEVVVLFALILVPAAQVVAEVHPTALVAVEYLPASHSVHTSVPPMEYFPAVQSSHFVSEVKVLASLILVPAPHVFAALHELRPISSEN